MRRATTPTVTIGIDQSLVGCWYRVTLAQKHGKTITKTQDECILSEDGKTIQLTLSQRETLAFSTKSDVMVQVRFGANGSVAATNIVTVKVGEILDETVI